MQPTYRHPALVPVGAFLQAVFGLQAADSMNLEVDYTGKQPVASENTCGLIAAVESSNAQHPSRPFDEPMPELRARVQNDLGEYLKHHPDPESVKADPWVFAPLRRAPAVKEPADAKMQQEGAGNNGEGKGADGDAVMGEGEGPGAAADKSGEHKISERVVVSSCACPRPGSAWAMVLSFQYFEL